MQNIKTVSENYTKIKEAMEARYRAMNFIRSPDLVRQLGSILADLKSHDVTLTTVGFLANTFVSNFQGNASAIVANIRYFPYDTRALEYILQDIERNEEEGTELGVVELQPELQSNESLGRKYYAEGLSFYEGRLKKYFGRAAGLFLSSFSKGIWQAAFYLGNFIPEDKAWNRPSKRRLLIISLRQVKETPIRTLKLAFACAWVEEQKGTINRL